MRNNFGKTGVLLALLVIVVGCLVPSVSQARRAGSGMRVLVMVDDSDKGSVRRNGDVAYRVLTELSDAMQDHGFRMVSEEMISESLGWGDVRGRIPRRTLFSDTKLANKSANIQVRSRALVFLDIHAYTRPKGRMTELQIRVSGVIFDGKTNQQIKKFEVPLKKYPAPARCGEICKSEKIGEHAKDIAEGVGFTLGQMLANLVEDSADEGGGGSGHGIMTTYSVQFKRFRTTEVMTVVRDMREFPGYSSEELVDKNAAKRVYAYLTTALPSRIEEWLIISLSDMGLNPDRDVLINFSGTTLTLQKITSRSSPRSSDSGKRFR